MVQAVYLSSEEALIDFDEFWLSETNDKKSLN